MIHPFFVRVVPSKTLLEAAGDDGQESLLSISGADSNESATQPYNASSWTVLPVVLIEPLTTVKEFMPSLGSSSLLSLLLIS